MKSGLALNEIISVLNKLALLIMTAAIRCYVFNLFEFGISGIRIRRHNILVHVRYVVTRPSVCRL